MMSNFTQTPCFVILYSKRRLELTLPLDVVEDEGTAQWDATKMILTVTLPVKTQF